MISPPYFPNYLTIPSMYLLIANASSSLPLTPIAAHASEMLVNPLISANRTTVSKLYNSGKTSFVAFTLVIYCCNTREGIYLFRMLMNSIEVVYRGDTYWFSELPKEPFLYIFKRIK